MQGQAYHADETLESVPSCELLLQISDACFQGLQRTEGGVIR